MTWCDQNHESAQDGCKGTCVEFGASKRTKALLSTTELRHAICTLQINSLVSPFLQMSNTWFHGMVHYIPVREQMHVV